jgi:hypothetical protein
MLVSCAASAGKIVPTEIADFPLGKSPILPGKNLWNFPPRNEFLGWVLHPKNFLAG